jgi:hypothetical protein
MSKGDRIGTPDPKNEPRPPKVESAGELGPTGEAKKVDKDAIWRDRPETPDEKPADPAARKVPVG